MSDGGGNENNSPSKALILFLVIGYGVVEESVSMHKGLFCRMYQKLTAAAEG